MTTTTTQRKKSEERRLSGAARWTEQRLTDISSHLETMSDDTTDEIDIILQTADARINDDDLLANMAMESLSDSDNGAGGQQQQLGRRESKASTVDDGNVSPTGTRTWPAIQRLWRYLILFFFSFFQRYHLTIPHLISYV